MAKKRVLPYSYEDLDQSDWIEIYNTCPAHLTERLPVDGLGMTEAKQRRLPETAWVDIYLSVKDKRDQLRKGFYGNDRVAREWRDQMASILQTLHPVANFIRRR